MNSVKNLVQAVFFLCLFISASAHAAIQTLMHIPGIDGEYEGAGFENWIEINSFSGVVEEGGCDVFVVEKALDSSSAQILSATALRIFFDEILVYVLQPGLDGNLITRQRIYLRNSVISKVAASANAGNDFGEEELVLEAELMRLESFYQNADGTVSLTSVAEIDCGKIRK